VERCALFVDAGYVLADGAMAVHGTRRRESVSWDYGGLLQYLASIARERSEFPLLRCYWYEATLEGRRTSDHDAVADLPGVKLRVAKMRPGRREGVESEIHRDLATLARNKAISDALVISAEEDLAQVIEEVQDLGIRVLMAHITVDGNWSVSRALRQECDDIVEVTSSHLRPYVELIAGAEPPRTDEADDGTLVALRPQPNGNGNGAYKQQTARAELPAIYAAPVAADYQRAALTPQLAPPMTTQRPEDATVSAYREEPHADEAAPRQDPSTRDLSSRDPSSRDLPSRDLPSRDLPSRDLPSRDLPARQDPPARPDHPGRQEPAAQRQDVPARTDLYGSPPPPRREERADVSGYTAGSARDRVPARGNGVSPGAPSREGSSPAHPPFALPAAQQAPAPQPGGGQGAGFGMSRGGPYGSPQPSGAPAYSGAPTFTASPRTSGPQPALPVPPGPQPAQPVQPLPAAQGAQQSAGSLGDAVQSAHAEGEDFGASVARDAPALWLEAVLARKPRMPSDLEARLLQGSALPIDFLLHDEVRHALRRGFWDALERTRR
jgi:uncharacterized LabA/DUF88 family protein